MGQLFSSENAMAKAKLNGKDIAKAVKAGKDTQVKAISSVKNSGVAKPSQNPKESKELAKEFATKADKNAKKAKKAPTPESSSASSASSDENMSSASSPSSDDESELEEKKPAKANGGKMNGISKTSVPVEANSEPSESSDSSDSSEAETSSEEEEASSPPLPVSDKSVKAPAKKDESSDESSDESGESSDESEGDESASDEEAAVPGAVDTQGLNRVNGKLEQIASKQVRGAKPEMLRMRRLTSTRHLQMRTQEARNPVVTSLTARSLLDPKLLRARKRSSLSHRRSARPRSKNLLPRSSKLMLMVARMPIFFSATCPGTSTRSGLHANLRPSASSQAFVS